MWQNILSASVSHVIVVFSAALLAFIEVYVFVYAQLSSDSNEAEPKSSQKKVPFTTLITFHFSHAIVHLILYLGFLSTFISWVESNLTLEYFGIQRSS